MNAVLNAPQSWQPWADDMAEVCAEVEQEMEALVTEDQIAVDNILSEKQQRLLTEPLYGAWTGPEECTPGHQPFLALANVGLFHALREPPLVPDMMLALDVPGPGADLSQKINRSYFVWEQGKPPVVAIEIVSNREGNEDIGKFHKYAAAGVGYYVIFDPWRLLSERVLRIYQLVGRTYVEQAGGQFKDVGLGVTLWQGEYEGQNQQWLRWVNQTGKLIPTSAERAASAEQQVERLTAQLRALGIESSA